VGIGKVSGQAYCVTDVPEPIQLPRPTKYKLYCCKNCATLEGSSDLHCHYWKIELCMPIFVSILILFCAGVYAAAIFPRLPIPAMVVTGLEVFASVMLFFWSYFAASCRDPGYLPYDWHTTKRSKYAYLDLLAGTAVRKDQFEYVASVPRPPGCSFSKEMGRYVIRADHICGWIGNWVGKRNHKHFILFVFWGSILSVSLFVWRWIPRDSLKEKSMTLYIMDIAACVLEALFGLLQIGAVWSFVGEVLDNKTRVQRHKGEDTVQLSNTEAMQQICGTGSMCCWFCPGDAFPDDIILDQNDILDEQRADTEEE
jgi:hypothetical protein